MSYDIFISYARHDGTPLALKLAKTLRESGLTVFWDQDSIPPGENWERTLDAALDSAVHILVILTPFSVKSEEVEAEWRPMLSKGKNVIPVLYLACDMPRRLSMRQFIDFSDETRFQLALSELIGAMNAFAPTSAIADLSGKALYKRAKMYAGNGMDAQAFQDFLILLGETDERSRRSAARWLGQINHEKAAGVLVNAIQAETSPVVLVSILDALERIIRRDNAETIVLNLPDHVIHSQDSEVRQAFIKLVGILNDPDLIPYLIGVLANDSVSIVRWRATIALGKFAKTDSRAMESLKRAAKIDKDEDIRDAASRVLSIINGDI